MCACACSCVCVCVSVHGCSCQYSYLRMCILSVLFGAYVNYNAFLMQVNWYVEWILLR